MKFLLWSGARRLALATLVVTVCIGNASATLAAPIPSNQLRISMDSFLLTGAYSVVGGQPTGEGSLRNGNVGEYPEGGCVPVLIQVTNRDNDPGDTTLTVEYDYFNSAFGIIGFNPITTALTDPEGDADNLNDFAYGAGSFNSVVSFQTASGSTVAATITGPFSGASGSGATTPADPSRHYFIDLTDIPEDETVQVLFCADLDQDASEYGSGASMSVRTGDGGRENIAVMARDLLVLPSITISKTVSGGTSLPSDWSFTVTPSINGQSVFTIPLGDTEVFIDNVEPDGTYIIAENPGPADYTLTSVSGTNCGFFAGSASATVSAADVPVSAICEFTNTFVPPLPFVATTGTLLVIKNVINDDTGTSTASDFTINAAGTNPDLTSFAGNASGTLVTMEAGAYEITETAFAGYTAAFSADCVGTMVAGEARTCTVTNNDDDGIIIIPPFVATTGTLLVIKNVINDDVGTSVAGDFTLNATGTNPSMTSFPGNASGTLIVLEAGSYAITESSAQGYAASFGADCSGVMIAGEARTCTVTNDDDEEGVVMFTLTLTKNGNGTGTVASDRTLGPSEGPWCDPACQGDVVRFAAGTVVTLTATPSEGSTFNGSWSGACTGTGICVITMNSNQAVNAHFALLPTPCTSNCGGGGGGGGGSGGGSVLIPIAPLGGPAPAPAPAPVPTPAVLGVNITVDEPAAAPAPEPRVLGSSIITELPVTGIPGSVALVLLSAPILWLSRRKK